MIRILKEEPQFDDIRYVELAGLSTDSKPKKYATGSLFLEVNTGDVYAYDESSTGTWTKIAELGGPGDDE